MNLTRLYRNWHFHNIIGHPVAQITYLLMCNIDKQRATELFNTVHDATLPENV